MIKNRKKVRINITDNQRKFLNENGVKENDGKIMSQIMVLLFEKDFDGKLISNSDSKKISLYWKNDVIVSENDVWVCQVTMNANSIGSAKPLRKIEISDIIAVNGLMQNVADYIWNQKRDDVIELLDLKIDSSKKLVIDDRDADPKKECTEKNIVPDDMELRFTEDKKILLSKMEKDLRKTEVELRREYDEKTVELKNESANLKIKVDQLSHEKNIMMNYYESQIKALANEEEHLKLACELKKMEVQKQHVKMSLPTMSQSVVRISRNEFKCSFIQDGNYSVKINADLTKIRFSLDDNGYAICRNGIITVRGLNSIDALDNKVGELNWKMIDDKTLEISI